MKSVSDPCIYIDAGGDTILDSFKICHALFETMVSTIARRDHRNIFVMLGRRY